MQIEDRAILSTLILYLRSLMMNPNLTLPPLAYDPTAFCVVSGVDENLYNSVFLQHPTDDVKLIQELRDIQSDLKLPLTAWITADTHAKDLAPVLAKNFVSPGAFYGMLLELDHANLTACSPRISIEQVQNPEQANHYAAVFSEVFNFPNFLKHKADWAISQYQSSSPIALNYIAKWDGKVAGICSLIVNNTFTELKVGGLYNACVLPEFRNLGVGTAMACHRVTIAQEMGLKYLSILLMSDAMAKGYCERLGFVNYQPLMPYYIR